MSTLLGDPLPAPVWKSGTGHRLATLLAAAALFAAFFDTLRFMAAVWGAVEEYSYGWFIPAISAFLVWQKTDRLRALPLRGAWSGLWLVALALALRLLGDLSAIRLFAQYGFVVGVFGVAACTVGWRALRVIAVPLAVLVFMIPLPQFLLRELSQSLQLLSSQIGVALIRAADVSVFLEGNVIDLGAYKLQVVEACSGLRYLFPLMVIGFIAAYFFQAPLWQRVLVVLSTVPLTILINSLRIGVIGISVDRWGKAMAEGLLHDFEGGFMFLLCLLGLLIEVALLARLARRPLRSVLGFDLPPPAARGAPVTLRPAGVPAGVVTALLATVALAGLLWPASAQIEPPRTAFSELPLRLDGGWQGRAGRLEPDVLAILALDDYALADYSRAGEPAVNFYAAYYASQSGGESSHSPRTCIPGGGWAITEIAMTGVSLPGGVTVPVNRVLIARGEQRQLVYYWFRQRGRSLTDEFEVKWQILRDGLVRHRSDGALLRLVTPVATGESVASADRRLADFMAVLEPRIATHVPD